MLTEAFKDGMRKRLEERYEELFTAATRLEENTNIIPNASQKIQAGALKRSVLDSLVVLYGLKPVIVAAPSGLVPKPDSTWVEEKQCVKCVRPFYTEQGSKEERCGDCAGEQPWTNKKEE